AIREKPDEHGASFRTNRPCRSQRFIENCTMAWTDVLKAVIQNGLARTGYTIKSIKSMEGHWMVNVGPIARLFAKVEQFAVSPEGKRSILLASLTATSIVEALFILKYLYAAMEVEGDICEFGVAAGATSALLANE